MKMKLSKAGILLSALALVLFVFSCAIWTGGSESGTIRMSFSPSSKALGAGATEVRAWLYSNNVLVPNSENSEGYYSANIGSGAKDATITISDLPPGDSYRIVVAAFKPVGVTTTVTAYGTSSLFGVKAGAETGVAIELKAINIAVPTTQIKNLVSVVYDGSTITAASGSALYSGGSVTALTAAPWPTSTKGSINSLNLTADENPVVLVNTTKGVYRDNGNPIGLWEGTPPSVLQSGGLDLLTTYFYQAEKEMGGLVGQGNWNQIPLDIPVAGKPILDLLVWQKDQNTIFGYFATRVVGAFRVGSSDIENLKLEDILSGNENSPITFFGESLPLIQAFGYIGGNDLYLGTKSGVYKTNINTPKTSTPQLIDGTKGLDVTKIVVQGTTEAFLTAKELVILKGSTIYKMPFLTSVVGTLTDIAWKGTDLIVVGTNGICSLPTADL